ncbi:kinase-like protein [Rhizophagus irregularis]|nr:kinase-like protein [Rhizophagus irregularis]
MDEYYEYYRCQKCGQIYGKDYCKSCNSVRFRDNFAHWTSGDSNLDEMIQNSQQNADRSYKLIEWIEYSNLENIELIAHGGFGNVYKAIWKDGPLINYKQPWNFNKSKWRRKSNYIVAIKKFRNTTHASSEFLDEININMKINTISSNVIQIYGVTRDLQNGEYAIVTEFKSDGNLREKNYYHKDFHSGNILNSIDKYGISPEISDFGLCRPMEQSSADKTLCGVLPFVAPEILLGREFTEAADIYGIGMVMSEVISGEPPFIDRDYDEHLALSICYGQRPQIPEYTPEPYAELMKRCWDPIPTNRPTAKELENQFWNLFNVLNNNNSIELSEDRQLEIKEAFSQEREDKWKARLAELATNPIPMKRSQNMLTSKRLDYSQYLSQKLTVDDWNKLKLTD